MNFTKENNRKSTDLEKDILDAFDVDVKVPGEYTLEEVVSGLADSFFATLSLYTQKREESTNRRIEFVSKFFSPTLAALDEIGATVSSDIARFKQYRLPIRDFAENITAHLIAYYDRQIEAKKHREKMFASFFAPTVEIFNDFSSNFRKNISRLTSDLKTEFGQGLNSLVAKIFDSSSVEETQKKPFSWKPVPSIVLSQVAEQRGASGVSPNSSFGDDFRLALLALFILFSVTSATMTSIISHDEKVTVAQIVQTLPVQTQIPIQVVNVKPSLDKETCDKIFYERTEKYNNSIVEFLISKGENFDFDYRSQLASSANILDYKGSSIQNMALLKLLLKNSGEFSDVACSY